MTEGKRLQDSPGAEAAHAGPGKAPPAKIDEVWHAGVARCVESLGTQAFGDALAEAIAACLRYDIVMVFAYKPGRAPVAPYTNLKAASARVVVDDYIAGPFLMDPFYKAARDKRAEGILRLRDEAPDQFFDSEYYRTHYIRTGIGDEVGTLVRLDDDVAVILSLTRRRTDQAFSASDLRCLRLIDPVVRALMRRHWGCLPARFAGPRDQNREALDLAFQRFGGTVLSFRESEIVSYILRGHSSESIALQLGITTGTVKIHRRNAYARLGVSSQAELFHVFLRWMHAETDTAMFHGLASDLPETR